VDSVVKPVRIHNRLVGPGYPCFVIAEAGVNHNGAIAVARQLVDVAASAGADAVKFQTFVADRLATPAAQKASYQSATTGDSETQLEMLRRLELSKEAHYELSEMCAARGILFLSTPFDEESADFLESLGVTAFKIPSGELTNLPFLEHIGRKGKPVILSTGMATLEEVRDALQTILTAGSTEVVLLHCVSCYPAAPPDVNLRAMETMRQAFRRPVGYSDHTLGIEVSLAAVAMGACVIEKHFTLDRTLPGPDQRASLEPAELEALLKSIRTIEQSFGNGVKVPAAAEREIADVARKSVVAATYISAGTILKRELLAIRRPGTGLRPELRDSLIGRRAAQAIPAGSLVRMDQLA
jgi:N-acetylneuraminate synthase